MSDSTELVLLVDDEPNIRSSVRRLLRDEPYRVLEASSGEEALELLQSLQPALIVMDYRMPGLGGERTLATLRAAGSRIPVIIASGEMDASLERRLLGQGAQLCLQKTDLVDTLAQAVRALLRPEPHL